MIENRIYLLTSLPPLGGRLGEAQPVRPGELLDTTQDFPESRKVVKAILLGEDLMERQAYLAGEAESVSPYILSADQARGEAALPGYLELREKEAEAPFPEMRIWREWFQHLRDVARETGADLLKEYANFEEGLRRALTKARAEDLGIEPGNQLPGGEIPRGTEMETEEIVSAWRNAPDPLASEKALDEARLKWLDERDPWYSFTIDEIVLYTLRLVIFRKWHEIQSAEEESEQPSGERS